MWLSTVYTLEGPWHYGSLIRAPTDPSFNPCFSAESKKPTVTAQHQLHTKALPPSSHFPFLPILLRSPCPPFQKFQLQITPPPSLRPKRLP